MNICNWIAEREEANLCLENTLTSICDTRGNDPANPRIPRLQSNIPPLKTRVADITDNIGVGYFAFDSHIPSI